MGQTPAVQVATACNDEATVFGERARASPVLKVLTDIFNRSPLQQAGASSRVMTRPAGRIVMVLKYHRSGRVTLTRPDPT